MDLFQHSEAWLVTFLVQVVLLLFSHFSIRERHFNYWITGLLGVSIWLAPLLVTSLAVGFDPRPILLLVVVAVIMFAGVGLEMFARREPILSVMFHTVVVLAIGGGPALMIVWIARSPPGTGWMEQVIMAGISVVICGVLTVFLHYNAMVGGLDIYHKNGLTPGERRTIADATYILDRKLQPRLGDVMARMRRANEQVQMGVASMESAGNLLSLVLSMLTALYEGAEETYLVSLMEQLEADNGLPGRQAGLNRNRNDRA